MKRNIVVDALIGHADDMESCIKELESLGDDLTVEVCLKVSVSFRRMAKVIVACADELEVLSNNPLELEKAKEEFLERRKKT